MYTTQFLRRDNFHSIKKEEGETQAPGKCRTSFSVNVEMSRLKTRSNPSGSLCSILGGDIFTLFGRLSSQNEARHFDNSR